MHNLKKDFPIISKDQKIFQAINRIIKSKIKILFVVDKKNKLIGSVASGDLRRSIGKKINLNEKVEKIMFRKPKYFQKKSNDPSTLKHLICVPIVNKKKQIIDFEYNQILTKDRQNTVFLMAGGKGVRLLPLTKKKTKTTFED
tara:strand:+ start:152 stop:580 length:429 start_codon:yes stop_codon:yes gene_type:complete